MPRSTLYTFPNSSKYSEHVPVTFEPASKGAGAMHKPWHWLESLHTFPESVAFMRPHDLGLSGTGKPNISHVPPRARHSDSVTGMAGLVTGADIGLQAQLSTRGTINKVSREICTE